MAESMVVLPRDVDKRNWEYLRSQLDVPCARWMAQSYVEPLDRLGEWRVFLVGGEGPIYGSHIKEPGS